MGYLLAVTAIFFWSWNIIVATGFASSLAPLEIAFGRWLVAACILLPLAWKRLAEGRKLLLKHAPLVVGLAVTGIVLDNTLIYFAGHTASAVNIGMLDMTGPIFLVLLSRIFLKTEISRRQFAGLIVAVIGVVVIILDGDFTRLSRVKLVSGDFFVLANTFGFAVYSLLQSRRPPEIEQSAMLGATVIVALPILAAGMLFSVPAARLESIRGEDVAVIVYLGVFNSVVSYLSWNTALNKIGNVKAGIIYYMLPVFSALEAHFVLKEHISLSQALGGAVVVAGVLLVSLPKKTPRRRPAPQ